MEVLKKSKYCECSYVASVRGLKLLVDEAFIDKKR